MSNLVDYPSNDPIGEQLDNEITSLQAQISALRAQRNLQATNILSSHATQATLLRLQKASQKSNSLPSQSQTSLSSSHEISTTSNLPTDTDPLLATSKDQLLHNQQNLYRACGTITAFKILDPDPNAVDKGNILGIRIEAESNGKFGVPYYVMLNKPFSDSERGELLRVYRHTLPPYIPLAELAKRYLPTTKGVVPMTSTKIAGGKRQDLRRFVRALRKEVVNYHNRVSVIKSLRKEFKLDDKDVKGKGREKVIEDICATDAEAKQVSIRWVDERVGRVVVDDEGKVVGCVVMGPEGRDWETERAVLRGGMGGLGKRLREGIY